jgi:hypothetical protein
VFIDASYPRTIDGGIYDCSVVYQAIFIKKKKTLCSRVLEQELDPYCKIDFSLLHHQEIIPLAERMMEEIISE